MPHITACRWLILKGDESMEKTNYKVYTYRWIVLLAFMFIAAVNQLLVDHLRPDHG